MRVLILGGSGMLGHKLAQISSDKLETFVTVRQPATWLGRRRLFETQRVKGGVSVQDFDSVLRAIADVGPSVVVNCIGIVKQERAAKDPIASISVNALFTHRLNLLCQSGGIRLIHISTDCVFSGRKGDYRESDVPDAEDLYGRTKLLGEVDGEHTLTLRTSMVGREITGANGLFEWFMNQQGKTIRGFKQAVFSGFTTIALSRLITTIISEHPELKGIWHASADPINKFDLLILIKELFQLKVDVEPDETFVCDRTLNSERLWTRIKSTPPPWPEMIKEMREDPTPYAEIRRIDAY
jgi:dTDP-4-dehydrorhamnose reductase